MANEALVKMIDTYIQQLTEIKHDVAGLDSCVASTFTNEEVAHYIFKLLQHRCRLDIVSILKDVHYFTKTSDVFSKEEPKNTKDIQDVEMCDFEELLLSNGYAIRKESYGVDKDMHRVIVDRVNGRPALTLKFDSFDNICGIDINTSV